MKIDNPHQLNEEFLKEFPLDRLKDMPLEEYTNNTKNSFSYWVEFGTVILGSVGGGSAYKFSIFRYQQVPKITEKIKNRVYDDKYAWYKVLGSTANEAYEKVRTAVCKVAKCGKSCDLEGVESVKELGPAIKWKIAFLYSGEKLIPYYSLERLKVISQKLGMSVDNNTTIAQIQDFLIKDRKDEDAFVYGKKLDDIWQKNDPKKTKATKITETNDAEAQHDVTPIESSSLKYESYIKLLKESFNLVLTGAPGTGKTFMAQAIADEMEAESMFVQFHPSYDYTDFVEGLRPIEKTDEQMSFKRRNGVFKEFCRKAIKNIEDSQKSVDDLTKEITWEEKLQQLIDDSIEKGTRYTLATGGNFTIVENREHGVIVHNEQNEKTTQVLVNTDEILELLVQEVPLNNVKDIRNHFNRKFGTQPDSYAYIITKAVRAMRQKTVTADAAKVQRKPFVFIIDEINRGEASKIFGELFYAIDPGYRGKKDHLVQTQYQNLVPDTDVFAKGFYVPDNVYILATMNDIDRSVESMDFAMRRRFTWIEVTPEDTQDMLDSLPCAVEAKATMKRLNEAIAATDGLGAAYSIGPSYFLKLGENGGDFNKLWEMNIEPLLKEYLRGFRKSKEILDKFCKAYFDTKEATEELIDEN